jgi:hypothetical protein
VRTARRSVLRRGTRKDSAGDSLWTGVESMSGSGWVRTAGSKLEPWRGRVDAVRASAERTIVWRVWERLLEIEFIDRSVALAAKAFVSFFPVVIVVAALAPLSTRSSIFTTITSRSV